MGEIVNEINCPYCGKPDLVARDECGVCGGTGRFYFSGRPVGKESIFSSRPVDKESIIDSLIQADHEILIDAIKEAAQEVFTLLGAGHSEAVYETALELELSVERKLGTIRRQVPCPIYYKAFLVGIGHIDILINDKIILELKSVAKLTSKDETQLGKYLVGMKLQKGLLINFNPTMESVEIIEHNRETYSTPDRNDDGPLVL